MIGAGFFFAGTLFFFLVGFATIMAVVVGGIHIIQKIVEGLSKRGIFPLRIGE